MLRFLPILMMLTGGYFLFALRAFFILQPRKTVSVMRRELKSEGKGAYLRMSLALAGTLGVGNITGVAVGILVGGAGTVFWLFLSSLFSMPLKFCEAFLSISVKSKSKSSRGMISVIGASFHHFGKPLSAFYAVLTVMLAFVMGSALQICAVKESAGYIGDLAGILFPILFVCLLVFCVVGRSERVLKATAVLIPIAMIMYTTVCIITIISNVSALPSAVSYIMKDAFSKRAFLGFFGSYAVSSPIREGFFRGLLSNEAGAGTSAYAHAKGECGSPFFEGMLGMAEILFDTVILCMLTAFSILLSVDDISLYNSGADLLSAAFGSVFGGGYKIPLLFSIFLFAIATSVCWYEYGRIALRHRGISGTLYFAFFLLFSLLGTLYGAHIFIPLCDTLLFFLSLISIAALLKNRTAVCREARNALHTADKNM